MTIPDRPAATLRLRIDSAALAANWQALDRMSGHARAGAAVKANAYGLGVAICVPTLAKAGARDFFVAHWSEVPGVLAHVPGSQIAVLHGAGTEQEAAFARACGALPVINSLQQAALWMKTGGGPCHLMVDTGINRLGIAPQDAGDAAIGGLDVQVLMSHLASADEDAALNAQQCAAFLEVTRAIRHKTRSLANSAGIALGSNFAFDLTRPGLSLYGGIARSELAHTIRQVAFPEAAVIQRRKLKQGQSVGYNATFVAPRDMETATVSIGYADGFLRSRGRDCALHHSGRDFPVIGRVSMDMIVIDCSAAPDLKIGTFLQVPFDLPRVAKACGLSQYELLTTIGARFDIDKF